MLVVFNFLSEKLPVNVEIQISLRAKFGILFKCFMALDLQSFQGNALDPLVHVPNFGGCQGRRTGVWVTTVSNLLILGGWVTKDLKNCDEKWGGGVEGWVTTIF